MSEEQHTAVAAPATKPTELELMAERVAALERRLAALEEWMRQHVSNDMVRRRLP